MQYGQNSSQLCLLRPHKKKVNTLRLHVDALPAEALQVLRQCLADACH
jgi:hypothetical protein